MGRETGGGRSVVAALIPVMLSLLGPLCRQAGRLAWLAPAAALPAGLGLCWVWKRFSGKNLPQMLEGSFGKWGGKLGELVYLLWGLFLLSVSARRYAGRLLTAASGENARWLYLAAALGFALWLGREDGRVFLRTGRLFFGAVAAALLLAVVLTLPALDWRNLFPPAGSDWTGLPRAALTVLALAGYGVYGLCLPDGERGSRWSWAILGCGGFTLLLAATLGTFGPALAGRMEEPFLLLLEGAAAPGVFWRGEAALAAVLLLADIVLLALLTRGCGALWRGLIPKWRGRGLWLLTAAAFWWAGVQPAEPVGEGVLLWGGLLLGGVVPAFAVLTERGSKTEKGGATSCVKK